MTEKKDIERLFQEKFKDFEATPPAQAWENITLKLQSKKKKKRIIAFWFKISGIAATLIIGYFAIDNFSNSTQSNDAVNNTEKVETSEKYSNRINQTRGNQKDQKDIDEENSRSNKMPNQNTTIVVTKDNKENIEQNSHSQLETNPIISKTKNPNKAIVSSGKNSKKEQFVNYDIVKSQQANNKKPFQNRNPKIVVDLKENVPKKNQPPLLFSETKEVLSGNKSKEKLVQNDSEFSKNNSNLNNEESKETDSKAEYLVNSNSKNSIIASSQVITKDSIIVAFAKENPLDKILKEKEGKEKIIVAEKISKWKLRPNLAPLIISATQGSPISSEFTDNTKDFENSTSIGLGVDYAVSSKFTIRTGINKFDFKYNTNEIAYYSDLSTKNVVQNDLKTIDRRPEAASMIIEDKKTRIESAPEALELAIQNKEEGFLNQQFGYIEVPVEVSYKLLDKKFGIQFITGLSTLFLNTNKVSVVSSGKTTVVGEVNNLNKVHFSSNIGLGFKYSFLKSFEANFEPTLKYQINTFSDNSGGFKPYLIGFYTGLSFKF
jgi:hypothetical protein